MRHFCREDSLNNSAAVLAGSARLWTRDKRLAAVAEYLELAYVEQR